MDKERKWTVFCTKGVNYSASVDKVESLSIRLSERSQIQKPAHHMVLFAWLLEKAKTKSGQWLPRVVNEKGINYKGDQKSFWNERNVLFIHLRVSA